MKKGRFLNDFEEPPDYSALSNATENSPYAELGIRATSTANPPPILSVIESPEIRLELEPPKSPEAPVPSVSSFKITDADHLGDGSLRRKCEANLTAIQLLQNLEAEGRSATEAELPGRRPPSISSDSADS